MPSMTRRAVVDFAASPEEADVHTRKAPLGAERACKDPLLRVAGGEVGDRQSKALEGLSRVALVEPASL